jgi:hypothetical protein
MDVFCTDFDDNSRCVVRYSTFNNSSLGSHGQESSICGVRHWEIYDNTFHYSTTGKAFGGDPYPPNMKTWFTVRGGTGVVANNAGSYTFQQNWYPVKRLLDQPGRLDSMPDRLSSGPSNWAGLERL